MVNKNPKMGLPGALNGILILFDTNSDILIKGKFLNHKHVFIEF